MWSKSKLTGVHSQRKFFADSAWAIGGLPIHSWCSWPMTWFQIILVPLLYLWLVGTRQAQSYVKETRSLKSLHPWTSNFLSGGRNDAIVWNQVLTSSSTCQRGGVPDSVTALLRHHNSGLSAKSVRHLLGTSVATRLFLLSRSISDAKWKITDWFKWLLNDWYKAGLY